VPYSSAVARYVVDASAVLQVLRDDLRVAAAHELLAPTLLRSQVLSALHEAFHRGELDADVARSRIDHANRLKVRYLGDAVLRRRAWEIAERMGWASTYDAECLALTQLQADAFITTDTDLARRVAGIVPVATIDALALDG
jgi:predicted nucleic acid-binding protein